MTAAPPVRFDVAAFGELVIDLIPAGSDAGEPLYAARPGGAPGNVAAGIARLGLKAAMLSKVGRDPFGMLAAEALAATGVDTSAVRRAGVETTALAAVSLDEAGDRDFVLYRAGCADASYAPEEVDGETIRSARLLHVGSLALATPASRAAQRHAVAIARTAGRLVSADPNLRPATWADEAAMLAVGREAVASADIVKLSAEELAALAGAADRREAVARLWHDGLRVMAITDGAAGAVLCTADASVAVGAHAVTVVDTVGCGDAFMASLLAGLLDADIADIGPARLEAIGRRASAAGAVMATRAGAMNRMPGREEIETMLAQSRTEAE